MNEEIEKSELAVLFSEFSVDEITVKPWTIRQAIQLTPLLGAILKSLKERGFDLSEWFNVTKKEPEDIEEGKDNFLENPLDKNIELEDIISCVSDVAEFIPLLLSVSLNIPIEQAETISWGKALAVTAVIFTQNWNNVKNYWGLIQTGMLSQARSKSEPVPERLQG